MILDLFTRCVLISLLAFGGGGAALPLIERIAVAETGWVSAQDFATAVAFGYITPGPVLITMTFLGYRAAGLAGAFAATFGIFVMPWALAAAAAHLLQRWMQHPLLRHFGRGAAPAVVGLLVVTALHLARTAFASEVHVGIAGVALGLALGTKLPPLVILLGGAIVGAVYGLVIEGQTL
jgi:chromate transporter